MNRALTYEGNSECTSWPKPKLWLARKTLSQLLLCSPPVDGVNSVGLRWPLTRNPFQSQGSTSQNQLCPRFRPRLLISRRPPSFDNFVLCLPEGHRRIAHFQNFKSQKQQLPAGPAFYLCRAGSRKDTGTAGMDRGGSVECRMENEEKKCKNNSKCVFHSGPTCRRLFCVFVFGLLPALVLFL